MIALDAMGGDSAPRTPVAGAIIAANQSIPITLYGDETILVSHLNDYNSLWRTLPITIKHCSTSIGMAEAPSRAILHKHDSSLVRSMHDAANGNVSAVVSAGNSGAVVVAATLILGRTPGILRPALGSFFPTPHGNIFCLDLGANSDVRPEMLCQFAQMGSLYVAHTGLHKKPRVALISNGTEPNKGSQQVKQAHALLRKDKSVHFIGNLEARDLFKGYADVAVMDGFTGNIVLKTAQGTVQAVSDWLGLFTRESLWYKLSFLAGSPLFKRLRHTTNYARSGGGQLLGVSKPCFVSHGCSSPEAIANTLIQAYSCVRKDVWGQLHRTFAKQFHKQHCGHGLQREL